MSDRREDMWEAMEKSRTGFYPLDIGAPDLAVLIFLGFFIVKCLSL